MDTDNKHGYVVFPVSTGMNRLFFVANSQSFSVPRIHGDEPLVM